MVDGTKIDGIYVVHGITGYDLREELLENLLNPGHEGSPGHERTLDSHWPARQDDHRQAGRRRGRRS